MTPSLRYQILVFQTCVLFLVHFLYQIFGNYFRWTQETDNTLLSIISILPVVLLRLLVFYMFVLSIILWFLSNKMIEHLENRKAFLFCLTLSSVIFAWDMCRFGLMMPNKYQWNLRKPLNSLLIFVGDPIFFITFATYTFGLGFAAIGVSVWAWRVLVSGERENEGTKSGLENEKKA